RGPPAGARPPGSGSPPRVSRLPATDGILHRRSLIRPRSQSQRRPAMQERLPSAPPAEMPPSTTTGTGAPHVSPAPLADPRALQILTTEHWSLLSQRSLAWTESFSRAGMFLATLSAATVALALVGSVMRDGFVVFALVILPVVLFIGLATAVRLSQANT